MVLDHTQEPVRSPPDPPQEVRSSSSHGSAKPSTAPTRSSAACACRGVDAPDAEDSRARKRRLDSSGRPASLPCSPAVGFENLCMLTHSRLGLATWHFGVSLDQLRVLLMDEMPAISVCIPKLQDFIGAPVKALKLKEQETFLI